MIILLSFTKVIANERMISCNDLLDSCARTLKKSKEVIDKQNKLIDNQKTNIVVLENRNKELKEEVDTANTTSLGTVLLFLLYLL